MASVTSAICESPLDVRILELSSEILDAPTREAISLLLLLVSGLRMELGGRDESLRAPRGGPGAAAQPPMWMRVRDAKTWTQACGAARRNPLAASAFMSDPPAFRRTASEKSDDASLKQALDERLPLTKNTARPVEKLERTRAATDTAMGGSDQHSTSTPPPLAVAGAGEHVEVSNSVVEARPCPLMPAVPLNAAVAVVDGHGHSTPPSSQSVTDPATGSYSQAGSPSKAHAATGLSPSPGKPSSDGCCSVKVAAASGALRVNFGNVSQQAKEDTIQLLFKIAMSGDSSSPRPASPSRSEDSEPEDGVLEPPQTQLESLPEDRPPSPECFNVSRPSFRRRSNPPKSRAVHQPSNASNYMSAPMADTYPRSSLLGAASKTTEITWAPPATTPVRSKTLDTLPLW
eukprot:CAMPEP_0170261974 /NCGR_PEP_ID=MMETSP0116_2-20130129/30869_1 /TAXON_ID=400756 /ORGANISM="Durinskia baltica, Strain CSIRO CS-38" /LENGTH=402 /DNA_ID=CAMNT_0010513041 /DNA_START=108 /DNA_END=1313 /DNA_ORIENTATION=-